MSDRVELAVRELVAAIRAEMAPPSAPVRYLTIAEAAATLRISRAQLYRLLAAGELRSVYAGHRRIIPASALEMFGSRDR